MTEWTPTAEMLRALELANDLKPTPSNISKIAEATTPEAASWAFLQWDLRTKAKAKFALASEMIFTRDGLEMASHERVAACHARLFHRDGPFLDATSGIGSDSIALAQRGETLSTDINPEHLMCLTHNASVHGLKVQAMNSSCLDVSWEGRMVFADPARRNQGKKGLDSDSTLPPLDALLAKAKESEQVWIKLSPMFPDSVLEAAGHRLIFLSHQNDCLEALVEAGTQAEGPYRQAMMVESGESLEAGDEPTNTDEPLRFIYEANPAAVRAHCLGTFGMESLGEAPGWLTSDEVVSSPWLTPFEVIWHGGWRESTVAVEASDYKIQSVKTRGLSDIDTGLALKAIRKKQNRLPESGEAEVMIYRVGQKRRAIIARRVT